METTTRLQHYHNEEETQRCTDKALVDAKYMGINPVLRSKEQRKKNISVPVECYFSTTDNVWYARLPEKNGQPAGEWVRANENNLVGLIEQ